MSPRASTLENYMRPLRLLACLASGVLMLAATPSGAADAPSIEVKVAPARPLIEHRDGQQLLNFDLLVKNPTEQALRINRIQLSVFDPGGKLVLRRALDENGLGGQSGITTVNKRELAPHGFLHIFNPFYSLSEQIKIGRMEYRLFLISSKAPIGSILDYDSFVDVSVTPTDYKDATSLRLPLARRVIVFDGHDFYSHHRRSTLPKNGTLYAYDLVPVDADGEMYKGSPYAKENWYGYGSPIYAPAAGTVVATANTVPENHYDGKKEIYGYSSLYQLAGNFVTIDHGDGEFSTLLHMRPGSVRVKAGDHVRRGQLLGELGFSGDAIFPHLHYQLTDGPAEFTSNGLPSYFHDFRRLMGSCAVTVRFGQIDTGDIVEPIGKPPSAGVPGSSRSSGGMIRPACSKPTTRWAGNSGAPTGSRRSEQ